MASTVRERADGILERVLKETGARDPREFYRERLRELKEQNPEAYQEAVGYFEGTLVPSVATGEVPPLEAWTEYGRHLAGLVAPGRTVTIDASGRSWPFVMSDALDRLILHLPEGTGRALLVGLPRELTDPQRATYEWLVAGRQKLKEEG
jgi:hypothetical protein